MSEKDKNVENEVAKDEKRRGIPFSRRSVFAGLGLAMLSGPLMTVAPQMAFAGTHGWSWDVSEIGKGYWQNNFDLVMHDVPFDMSFKINWASRNADNSWNVNIEFYKKISKPWAGPKDVFFNAAVLIHQDGWHFTSIDPGHTVKCADWGSLQYYSPAATITIPAGGRSHITSKNRRYADGITSVGTATFDFYLTAPLFRTVHFMFRDENGRVRELDSIEVKNGTWIDANNAGFSTAYSIIQNQYGAAVAGASDRWYEGDRNGAWNWSDKFWSKEIKGDSWFWMKIENRTVHFMLNDENGNTRELCSTTVIGGSRLDTDNGGFSTAYNKIAQTYDWEVAKYSDRWYEGDKWGAWNWGNKFGSKTVTGETWIWASIDAYSVLLYADGTGDSSLIARYTNIPVGRGFSIPSDSSNKARKGNCNLNADYGTSKGSGFIGWYLNPELTNPAPSTVKSTNGSPIRLYARNRATLRVDYAPDSVRPDPAADYRTAPRDDAPRYPRAMELPVFGSEPAHRLDGVSLPATGDWADQHCCGYYGEVLTLPGFDTVYERLPEGRWRTFRAEGWSDPAAGASEVSEGRTERSSRSLLALRSAPSSGARVQMRQDSMRVVRWVESVNDGVDTSM